MGMTRAAGMDLSPVPIAVRSAPYVQADGKGVASLPTQAVQKGATGARTNVLEKNDGWGPAGEEAAPLESTTGTSGWWSWPTTKAP